MLNYYVITNYTLQTLRRHKEKKTNKKKIFRKYKYLIFLLFRLSWKSVQFVDSLIYKFIKK